jgi:hypothetical protein
MEDSLGRKRSWSKAEMLQVIKTCQSFQDAAEKICDEMIPADLDKESSSVIERYIATSDKVRAILVKLNNEARKHKKYRHKPELLEEKGLSSSQYSLFASQGSQLSSDMSDEDMEEDWKENLLLIDQEPRPYRKQPLSFKFLSRQAIKNRVKDIKIKFGEWCKEQDCSVSQLAGLLIHLDNYESKRDIAKVGWDLFLESEATNGSHEVSAVEAPSG